jgi:hypothetical protein
VPRLTMRPDRVGQLAIVLLVIIGLLTTSAVASLGKPVANTPALGVHPPAGPVRVGTDWIPGVRGGPGCGPMEGSGTGDCSVGLGPPVLSPAVNATYPPGRWGAATAYDPAEGYDLLFSGSGGNPVINGTHFGSTWAYRAGNWTDLTPANCSNQTCPQARTYAGMTYQGSGASGYIVLFGGQDGGTSAFLDDTWTFNGTWHNISALPLIPYVNSPPPVHWTAMTFDAVDNYSVLYGGCKENPCNVPSQISNETWGFRGISNGTAVWTNLTDPDIANPPALYGENLAYDPADGYVVLFGGTRLGPGSTLQYLNQTWTFDAGTWTNRSSVVPSTSNTPPTRTWGMMAFDPAPRGPYDPAAGNVLLFAGQETGNKTNNPTLDDTWSFAHGAWTNMTPIPFPSDPTVYPHPRFGGALAFDGADDAMALFGGLSGTVVGFPVLNDTWNYASGSWNQTAPPAVYPVSFTESGLPDDITWFVNVTGQVDLSAFTTGAANQTITSDLAPGTYSFSVVSTDARYGPAYAPSFIVNDTPLAVSVVFTLNTYSVSFVTSGLGVGTNWSVTVAGTRISSTGATIIFQESSGSYSYRVTSADTRYAPSYVPNFGVDGTPTSVNVTFMLLLYAVTFQESGLPPGTNWSVELANDSHSSTNTTIIVPEANGSFPLALGAVPGYHVPAPPASLAVNGTPVFRSIAYALNGTGSSSSHPSVSFGLSEDDGYWLIAIAIAAVTAAAVTVGLLRTWRPPPEP